MPANFIELIRNKIRRRFRYTASHLFARRTVTMRNSRPLISFTFDDFPRSALLTGGDILGEHGIGGTYYASLGLAGSVAPTGEIFHYDDLASIPLQEHELGCHTFSHLNATTSTPCEFERSVLKNRAALEALMPGLKFRTHSYPIGFPNLGVKIRSAGHFEGCRGGGQTYNTGTIDLNHLRAFFIEQSLSRPDDIERLVRENCAARGWLIFATHDICRNPTRFGCEPGFFERVVKLSVNSGAKIVTVSKALEAIFAEAKAETR